MVIYIKREIGGSQMSLPKDAVMLLSVVNMRLRDSYSSLDKLCDDLDENKDEIIERLSSIGYEYNEEINQFV